MTGLNTGGPAPRPVWRRSAARPAVVDEPERLCCGGPDRTVDEVFEEMRERKRLWDEERAHEDAEKKPDVKKDDEDDDAELERFRKDRYAVGLLRQDNGAWGHGPQYSGTLG
ncbi:hypothetical protein [Paractinoplanes brasiliensis]|uniref:Uncharacterized protein n=1 Tax=Paractinoplanes brasiliensis TaxID=52695 RepID=A0A4R6JQE5_9ACTN|nr:hypothetical protein [Actinoplanes brasiliensis]TDO37086.1 hypothetical protein C8E87_0681 [Actinoplanes brasiliensis]GID32220.1 hypothetical protein Abr02nite_72030 [Actinoplanes brasiliensis]